MSLNIHVIKSPYGLEQTEWLKLCNWIANKKVSNDIIKYDGQSDVIEFEEMWTYPLCFNELQSLFLVAAYLMSYIKHDDCNELRDTYDAISFPVISNILIEPRKNQNNIYEILPTTDGISDTKHNISNIHPSMYAFNIDAYRHLNVDLFHDLHVIDDNELFRTVSIHISNNEYESFHIERRIPLIKNGNVWIFNKTPFVYKSEFPCDYRPLNISMRLLVDLNEDKRRCHEVIFQIKMSIGFIFDDNDIRKCKDTPKEIYDKEIALYVMKNIK